MDKTDKHDDFVASCQPLSELLDSVREIEGFPIGKDEDILAQSDPPYYTACPNPYINNFIKKYGKPYDEKTDKYGCTPFVSDVAEGKYDPLYKFHAYPTKVPFKAIKSYIEHYTNEEDIVLDGFCGTGMVAIAAQLSNRRAIISDLSTAATYIASSYNLPIDFIELDNAFRSILKKVKDEYEKYYRTNHGNGLGRINYVVWSNVYLCPYCNNESSFWDFAVEYWDQIKSGNRNGIVIEEFCCKYCDAKGLTKKDLIKKIDDISGKIVQIPVLINYQYGSKRFEKIPDEYDLKLIAEVNNIISPYYSPKSKMMFKGKEWGDSWRAGYHTGVENVEDFFFHRTLLVIAAFYALSDNFTRETAKKLKFIVTAGFNRLTKLVRYMPQHKERNVGPLSGTLYLPDLIGEINVIDIIESKYNHLKNSDIKVTRNDLIAVSTQSATDMSTITSNSIDYIFTDPPFGDNLMYSELNFILESWPKVFTNNVNEAIINKSQGKDLHEYKTFMTNSFKEYYRLLKPNHWITVVFHNSKASVWNAIQDALNKAGFIVAQVTVMDKKKGTIKQVTNPGAVNNDLVINAYKPKKRFEENFLKKAGEGLERDFVEEHLILQRIFI